MIRRVHVALLATAVALGGVTAALAAGDPTPTAPPRIAFVANAFNPADALAVGPIAGQLGAPVFTTSTSSLSDAAAAGLADHAPELVLVAGGPAAIADGVLDQIRSATGLTGDAVDRVFGPERTATAAALASLLADRGIDAAFLPVDATATDSDLLDGLDSSAFQPAGSYALAAQNCPAGDNVLGVAPDGSLLCQPEPPGVRAAGDQFTGVHSGLDGSTFYPTTVDITAPTPGYLHVTSSTFLLNTGSVGSDHDDNAAQIDCDIEVDGILETFFGNFDAFVLASTFERCTHTVVVPVDAGPHTVRTRIDSIDVAVDVEDSTLSVLFTPFGPDGTIPTP